MPRSASCRRALPFLIAAGLLPLPAVCAWAGEDRSDAAARESAALLAQCASLEHWLERRGLVFRDSALDEHLATIARPLLPGTPPEHVQWRILAWREPLVNAVSLPDGTIYVSTGLLALLENDDQLAGVLAHEIAHVLNGDALQAQREYARKETARNGAALVAMAAPLSGTLIGSALALASAGLTTYVEFAGAAGSIALSATSGYGDAAEGRADEAARASLTAEGRDPAQVARSFEVLAQGRDPEPLVTFYSNPEKLRARAAAFRGTGGGPTAPSASGSRYLEAVQGAIRENVRADIESRRFRSAVAGAQRLVQAHAGDPEAVCLLGVAYLGLGPRAAEASAGQRASVKETVRHTSAEEDRLLEATPEGRQARQENWKKAEELFVQAAHLNERFAQPHLELGLLYEQQGRLLDARAEYLQYLGLAPEAEDRLRVQNRLAAEALSTGGKAKPADRRISSILVLPARITVTRFSIRGTEGLWEENDRFEDEYAALVGRMLVGHGAKVSQLLPETGMSAAQRAALLAIQRTYDAVDPLIKRAPGGVGKGRFTLGDSVAAYSAGGVADTLVFVRGKGDLAMDTISRLNSIRFAARKSRFEGWLGFVDARSGDVLAWVDFTCDGHPWNKDIAELATHIREALGGEPSAVYARLAKGAAPAVAPGK